MFFARGSSADVVVLDDQHPTLWGLSSEELIDAWVFAGPRAVKDVLVRGRFRMRQGCHAEAGNIFDDFRAAMSQVWG